MTPEEFAEQTRAAAQQVGRLSDDGVAKANAILREAQEAIVLKLADAPSEYGEWFYGEMRGSLDRIAADLEVRYRTTLERDLDRVAVSVVEAVDVPIQEAGLTLRLPQVSRQTVEALTGFSPGALIGNLTEAAKSTVQSQLQQAVLGILSPWELQQSLAKTLEGASIFGSIAKRAEAIWRTEAARTFNVLAQERYRRIETLHPGRMQKRWLHSGNTRHPRTHHAALDGTTIGIDQLFLVGSYAAEGPHDPNLPARETVRCGCTSMLVLIA